MDEELLDESGDGFDEVSGKLLGGNESGELGVGSGLSSFANVAGKKCTARLIAESVCGVIEEITRAEKIWATIRNPTAGIILV